MSIKVKVIYQLLKEIKANDKILNETIFKTFF
jgi:hypothetical protein